MVDGSRTNAGSGEPAPKGEDALLDAAMRQVDMRLVESLRKDELRRRRRRFILIGAFAMTFTFLSILLAFHFSATTRPAIEATRGKNPATQVSVSDVKHAAENSAQGWKLFNARKFDEAEDRFLAAVKLDPGLSPAWNGLGWARLNVGDRSGALEAFEKCLALQPKDSAAMNGMGQAAFFARRYEEAEKHWLAAAKAGATAPYFGLAKLYLLTGKYEEAANWAGKALSEPGIDKATKELIEKMMAAAKARQLDAELRKQIEPAETSDARASEATKTGWLLVSQGANDRAKDMFAKALKANPNDVPAQNGMGFALVNSGNAAEAIPWFRKVLKADPRHYGAMNGLARSLKAEGKVDEAIALWEKMVKEAPTPNAGTYNLANTYLEKGEPAKALPFWEQLAKSQPDNAECQQGLKRARQAVAEKK